MKLDSRLIGLSLKSVPFAILFFLFAFILALFSPDAIADAGQGGFYPLSQLNPRPEMAETVFASTRRLSMEAGVSCSSAIVSNDGYLLTALHCLPRCLEDAINKKNSQDARAFTRPGFTGIEILDQASFVKNCPADLVPFISDPDVQQVRLVWVGHGRALIDEAFLATHPLPSLDISRSADQIDDYAILKIDYVKNGDHPCMALGPLPAAGAPVWNVGYPSWTLRPGRRGATGAELVASSGQALAGASMDPFLQGIASTLSDPKAFWDAMGLIYGRPDLLRTDADSYFTNSGGSQVNQAGQLIAVLSSITKATQDSYNHAMVIGTSTERIRNEVTKELGTAKAQEIFNCHPVSTEIVKETLDGFFGN